MRAGRSLLFVSWLLVLFVTVGAWAWLPTLTGVHPDPNPFHFLPYPPGIAIAILAGSTGGMLNGLFALWKSISSHDQAVLEMSDPALFYLPPILGAFAGVLTFFLISAGGLSLIDPKAAFSVDLQQSPSMGMLIYKLTPTSPAQLATFVIYTTVAGYFFTSLPETFEVLTTRVSKPKEHEPTARPK